MEQQLLPEFRGKLGMNSEKLESRLDSSERGGNAPNILFDQVDRPRIIDMVVFILDNRLPHLAIQYYMIEVRTVISDGVEVTAKSNCLELSRISTLELRKRNFIVGKLCIISKRRYIRL
jgi:hypothetical protein